MAAAPRQAARQDRLRRAAARQGMRLVKSGTGWTLLDGDQIILGAKRGSDLDTIETYLDRAGIDGPARKA